MSRLTSPLPAWVAVAAAVAAAAGSLLLCCGRSGGFAPPIRLAEVQQIRYGHSTGGAPPVDREQMTITVSQADPYAASHGGSTSYVGSKSVTIWRPLAPPAQRQVSFGGTLSQQQLEQLVALLNAMRIWRQPRSVSLSAEGAGWTISVSLCRRTSRRLFAPGPYGGSSTRQSVLETWEFTTSGPATSRAFVRAVGLLESMTNRRANGAPSPQTAGQS